jgi:hypothetical protein
VNGKELGDAIQSLLRDYHDRVGLLISSDTSGHGPPIQRKNQARQRTVSVTKSQVDFGFTVLTNVSLNWSWYWV